MLSSFCFVAKNVLGAIPMYSMMRSWHGKNRGNMMASWYSLDPTNIETSWQRRIEGRSLEMSAALIGVIGWFLLAVPIVQLAWILSKGGKRKLGVHILLASLGVGGAGVECFARLMMVGLSNASFWLAKDFNLDSWDSEGDGTGWRVLEMIHIVTRGLTLWVDAFEALALFGVTVLLLYSVRTEPRFRVEREPSEDTPDASIAETDEVANETPPSPPPETAFSSGTAKVTLAPTFKRPFIYYGLFVGLLSLADFVFDILRFLDWMLFGRLAAAFQIVLGVVFLPIWLLCLARQLPQATERFEGEMRRRDLLLDAQGDEPKRVVS